jgi:hypothetical protein
MWGFFEFFKMDWSVNDIFELVKKLTRKNQAGAISAGDLFYMWNSEQMMYFQDLVGRWQKMSDGKSGALTGLITNETILGDLSPFITEVNLLLSGGYVDKPDDFESLIALRVGAVYKCTLIRPDQRPAVSQSVIDPPSIPNNKYYAVEYEDKYLILPTTITQMQLDYIARPKDIKWAYTFDAEGRQIYNPGLSVQPQWKNTTVVEITKRTLNNFGISWKDADFITAGKSAQLTGV